MKNYLEIMESAKAYVVEDKVQMSGPDQVADFIRPLVLDKTQESFFVLLMNTKNRLIDFHEISTGTVDRAHIHARDLFREAIVKNTTRIILAHNHPSGEPTPSAPDIEVTRSLVNAGKIIGIEIMDHIVMGLKTPTRMKDYISFREENLL